MTNIIINRNNYVALPSYSIMTAKYPPFVKGEQRQKVYTVFLPLILNAKRLGLSNMVIVQFDHVLMSV